MYSILIRVNHLKKVLTNETKESVPIHLDDGREPFRFWRGFTLVEKQPVKLVVDAFSSGFQNPREHTQSAPKTHRVNTG